MSEILARLVCFIHPSPARLRLSLATALLVGLGVSARSQEPTGGGRDAPDRPIAVWPPGPLEVIAAFERPFDPAAARSMVGRTIPYHDSAIDGQGQTSGEIRPAGSLRIVGARLADEGRTLLLATDPHPRVAQYRLLLPGATTSYDLSGIAASWSEPDDHGDGPKWTGWWPSLDLDATRRLTHGSRPHEIGLGFLTRPGILLLNAWVRLPAGKVAFHVESSGPIEEFTLGDAQGSPPNKEPRDGLHRAELAVESRGEPLFLTLSVRTRAGGRPLSLGATYRPAGERADRAFERDRLLVPWAPVSTDATIATPVAVPDLAGGDPERGRSIFRGDQARCAQCHAFRGEGGQVGPDLTNLASKGRADIYRSIAAPSAVIEPDYTTYTVATRDGQVLSGVARAEGPDRVRVTDSNAKATTVRRDEIQEIRPSATSIMPPGLAAALGDSAVRDLIAYLTSPAPPKAPAGRASS
jgi:putative heme-binding domain-containing protein